MGPKLTFLGSALSCNNLAVTYLAEPVSAPIKGDALLQRAAVNPAGGRAFATVSEDRARGSGPRRFWKLGQQMQALRLALHEECDLPWQPCCEEAQISPHGENRPAKPFPNS